MTYADIGFIAILAIALLVGLIIGLHKSLKGFFLTIAIILLSLFLVGVTFTPVRNMDMCTSLEDSLYSKTSSWGDVFTKEIYIADDGSFYVFQEYDGAMQKVQLQNAFSDDIEGTIKAKFSLKLAEWFIQEDGNTLAGLAAEEFTSIIVAVVAFILYAVVLGILCSILRKIFKKMYDSDNKLIKGVDRVLGGVVSVGLIAIFLLLVLFIFERLGDKAQDINDFLLNSTIVKYFYENNPVSKVLSSIFG